MAIGGVLHPNHDVSQLSAAVDACFSTPLSCLSPEETSDRLVALTNITSRLDALRVETVAAAKAADVGKLNDQRNVANHVAERTNNDPATTRSDQLLANWLTDFPEFAAAYQDGTLTTAHLNLLRRKDNARVHQQMIGDQRCFIQWFTNVAFRDLDEVVERWLMGADPDGAEPSEQLLECTISLRPLPGGLGRISGKLDPLSFAAIRTAMNTEAEKVRREHKEAGISSTVGQRNHEALARLIARGAISTGPGIKPLINIVIDQSTYEETLEWLADPDNVELPVIDPAPEQGFGGRKCQLIDGTPIHPLYVIAASAKAVFRRIVYGAKGRRPEVSYESRSFPPWISDLVLIATNGRSANRICDAPFHWLQIDHIEPDSLGGETTLANARPLSAGDNGWRGNDTNRGRWPMPDAGSSRSDPDQEELEL